ncbi:MAG: ABC transporter permease [Planctomycetota bacterium]|nr:ABC transporter permease [Planctomycetota bacterium]MDA1137082.1 ABC transporter permease [Planctomycetota bacterium]
MKKTRLIEFLAPVFLLCVVILLWHLVTVAFSIQPFLLPGPGAVLDSAQANLRTLVSATLMTAAGALGGFLVSFLLGSVIAFLFSQSRIIQYSFYPYAIFLQTVPIVAIAPLIVIWCGTGFQSVIMVAMIISLFPIITNGTAGLTNVSQQQADLFSLYNASRWQILWKLRLPNSVPNFVTGAKISSGLSVIGAIIGEFFVGYGTKNFGLGYLITMTSGQLKTPYLFATIICSTLLGVFIFLLINLIASRILKRWQE